MVRSSIIGILAFITAGYMILDATRHFLGYGFLAPSGQLGPWATVASLIGIEPDSSAMAAIFFAYGALLLGATVFYLRTRNLASAKVLIVVAICGLWYVPFGTFCLLVMIFLLARNIIGSRNAHH
ncbi:hypothetical protein [Corynebacterium mustelae]|nr:hypothetical protein [Corynebacterium mustelae]